MVVSTPENGESLQLNDAFLENTALVLDLVIVELVRAVLLGERGLVWQPYVCQAHKSRLGFFAPSSHGQNQKARVHHFDLFLLDLGTKEDKNESAPPSEAHKS